MQHLHLEAIGMGTRNAIGPEGGALGFEEKLLGAGDELADYGGKFVAIEEAVGVGVGGVVGMFQKGSDLFASLEVHDFLPDWRGVEMSDVGVEFTGLDLRWGIGIFGSRGRGIGGASALVKDVVTGGMNRIATIERKIP